MLLGDGQQSSAWQELVRASYEAHEMPRSMNKALEGSFQFDSRGYYVDGFLGRVSLQSRKIGVLLALVAFAMGMATTRHAA